MHIWGCQLYISQGRRTELAFVFRQQGKFPQAMIIFRIQAISDTVAITIRFRSGVLGTVITSDVVASPYNFESATGENPLYSSAGQDCYRIFGTEATLAQAIELAAIGGEVLAFGTITGGDAGLPYYQRLYANALSRSIRAAVTLGDQSGSRSRDWLRALPRQETLLPRAMRS